VAKCCPERKVSGAVYLGCEMRRWPDNDAASSVATDARMMQQAQPKSAATRADATTVRSPSWAIRRVGTLLSTSLASHTDLKVIQQMLGHSSIVTTADTYTKRPARDRPPGSAGHRRHDHPGRPQRARIQARRGCAPHPGRRHRSDLAASCYSPAGWRGRPDRRSACDTGTDLPRAGCGGLA
jgi:hypothetical protein